MFLWEIRSQGDQKHRRGWLVAWSQGEVGDIARHENADLVGEPVEWLPGIGSKVYWRTEQSNVATVH